jgi:hypothetical protein
MKREVSALMSAYSGRKIGRQKAKAEGKKQ